MTATPGELLRRYGLRARKSFGQHFLHAAEVHEAIAQAVPLSESDRIVEIGAGLGSLTARLLASGADVWALERDRDLCPVLRQEFGALPNFRLFETDAVRFDYRSAADDRYPRPVIIGNLPYHLTGPLLYALLNHHETTGPWIVMVQKEVADRVCAPPGTKTYGGISVGLGRLRAASRVVSVPRGAFTPPPNVDSAVLLLSPRATPRGEVRDAAGFLHLVRTAFQRRRKTLTNALGALAPRPAVLGWCDVAGVDPSLRPERLTAEEFAALQRAREQATGECEGRSSEDA